MIIECIKCSKKFEVNSDLIPSEGRTIQCGSCNHIWFFVKKEILNNDVLSDDNNENNEVLSKIDNTLDKIENDNIINENETDQKNTEIIEKNKKRSNFTFGKLLSYLFVIIISFFGIMVLIDTFDKILYELFPDLELVMFNFFEILKDINSFIKDLI